MISRILRVVVVLEVLGAWAIADALHDAGAWDWPAALALGVSAPLGVHASIVMLGFVVARAVSGPAPAAWGVGPAGALRMVAREFGVSLRLFQVEIPWMPRRILAGTDTSAGAATDAGAAAGHAVPVLLIHGFLCNRQVWRPMAAWLAARGHAIEVIDLEPVFGSIDAYADKVDAAVRALQARTGTPQVALVCHSMGGLAARAYLRAHGTAGVAGVVTLGTPHRGTFHARFGHGQNAAQMRQDSAWLQALDASESPGIRRLFTIVLTHHDNIVVPPAAQVLPDARVVELGGLGHLTLAYDARVRDAVGEALARF